MSNIYCQVSQFSLLYDIRQMGMLARDDNTRGVANDEFTPSTVTKVQFLLDVAASELDSFLAGRWTLPVFSGSAGVPLVLTRWVAAKAVERHYIRRSDMPKQVAEEVKWADEWIKQLLLGVVSLVDANQQPIGRAVVATLDSSDATDGTSRFDGLRDFSGRGSDTSTGRGQ